MDPRIQIQIRIRIHPKMSWIRNNWWVKYLFQVACDLLCVPATSTPSERLFSQSGLLSGHRFSRTTPKNLEYRVLAKLNMKKECNSFIFYFVDRKKLRKKQINIPKLRTIDTQHFVRNPELIWFFKIFGL
jgi:hypothetical protein